MDLINKKIFKKFKLYRNYLFYESKLNVIFFYLSLIFRYFINFIFCILEHSLEKTNFTSKFLKLNIVNKNILWCTVCNDKYYKGLLVLLYSIQKHNTKFNFNFKVYYNNDLSPKNMENLKKVYSNIIFENNSIFNDKSKLYMCLLPFKEYNYDKVIFIDSDILCLGDIMELSYYNYKYLTVCVDTDNRLLFNNYITIPKILNINTGVFILPKNLRNKKIFDELINYSNKYPNEKLGDQDIINKYFYKKYVTYLPSKFNCKTNNFRYIKYNSDYDIRLLHYTGIDKPFLKTNYNFEYIKNKNSNIKYVYKIYYKYIDEINSKYNL